ncbi:MAG: TRAP transporter substrate-binding protein DctP [Dehalococcoidales bacterium]
MNKKIMLVSLALVLAIGLIVPSCAKPAPAPGVAPTAAPPGTEYQYKWRNSTNYPSDSEGAQAMFRFGDLVRERTKGRVDITGYADGALGGWDAIQEMVIRGDVEMMFEALDDAFDPRIAIGYYIPYVFIDYDAAQRLWAPGGYVYEVLNNRIMIPLGYRALGAWCAGISGITTDEVPPEPFNPDVPKNMKIRVMALTACQLMAERLGYMVVGMPFADVYTSIQTGIVDGQQGGGAMQAWIFKDIQNTYMHTKDYIEPIWFVVNNDAWASLTEEDQQILTETAQEIQNEQAAYAKQMDEKYMQMLRDYGWTVLVPTDEEWKYIQKVMFEDVWPELTPVIGSDLINGLYDALGMPRPG